MTVEPLGRFRLDGRAAVVTGASSGLGTHVARTLHAVGGRAVAIEAPSECCDRMTIPARGYGFRQSKEVPPVNSESAAIPPEQLPELRDHEVIDPNGAKIGVVSDVIVEDPADGLFATVRHGLLRSENLVPLHSAYMSADGRIVVPYDKATVLGAPRPSKDHFLTTELDEQVRAYYELNAV